MTSYSRICLEDWSATDGKNTVHLKRGKEYITSAAIDGKVMVFSSFWVNGVPVSIFGGDKQFT